MLVHENGDFSSTVSVQDVGKKGDASASCHVRGEGKITSLGKSGNVEVFGV